MGRQNLKQDEALLHWGFDLRVLVAPHGPCLCEVDLLVLAYIKDVAAS